MHCKQAMPHDSGNYALDICISCLKRLLELLRIYLINSFAMKIFVHVQIRAEFSQKVPIRNDDGGFEMLFARLRDCDKALDKTVIVF